MKAAPSREDIASLASAPDKITAMTDADLFEFIQACFAVFPQKFKIRGWENGNAFWGAPAHGLNLTDALFPVLEQCSHFRVLNLFHFLYRQNHNAYWGRIADLDDIDGLVIAYIQKHPDILTIPSAYYSEYFVTLAITYHRTDLLRAIIENGHSPQIDGRYLAHGGTNRGIPFLDDYLLSDMGLVGTFNQLHNLDIYKENKFVDFLRVLYHFIPRERLLEKIIHCIKMPAATFNLAIFNALASKHIFPHTTIEDRGRQITLIDLLYSLNAAPQSEHHRYYGSFISRMLSVKGMYISPYILSNIARITLSSNPSCHPLNIATTIFAKQIYHLVQDLVRKSAYISFERFQFIITLLTDRKNRYDIDANVTVFDYYFCDVKSLLTLLAEQPYDTSKHIRLGLSFESALTVHDFSAPEDSLLDIIALRGTNATLRGVFGHSAFTRADYENTLAKCLAHGRMDKVILIRLHLAVSIQFSSLTLGLTQQPGDNRAVESLFEARRQEALLELAPQLYTDAQSCTDDEVLLQVAQILFSLDINTDCIETILNSMSEASLHSNEALRLRIDVAERKWATGPDDAHASEHLKNKMLSLIEEDMEWLGECINEIEDLALRAALVAQIQFARTNNEPAMPVMKTVLNAYLVNQGALSASPSFDGADEAEETRTERFGNSL